MSMVLLSGSVIVKNRVSLFPWLFVFDISHPLSFFRKIKIPLSFVGFPWTVYLEKSWR